MFVLKSQDVTADVLVDFWAILNQKVREMVKSGHPPELAIKLLRIQWNIPPVYEDQFHDVKLRDAVRIARSMRTFPNRKIAD